MDERMKKVFEPSEKVQKMYEAVAAFVEEKRDLSTLKVSEITSRAGIGKGTAYEYFSSKEEIIVYATLWLYSRQRDRLVKEVSCRNGFKEKFLYVLEWIQKHKGSHELMLKAMNGSFQGDCEKIKDCISKEIAIQVRTHLGLQINSLLEQGYEEGLFTEQSAEKRVLVFFGALMQLCAGTMNLEMEPDASMSEEKLKEFIYDCMIKALN